MSGIGLGVDLGWVRSGIELGMVPGWVRICIG